MTAEPRALPVGWAKTALGAVVEPISDKTDPSSGAARPFIGLEHIDPGTGQLLGHGYARDVKSPKSVFCVGDVLYGKLRPYLRKVWFAEFDGVCSTDILVYRPSQALDGAFLAYVLRSEPVAQYAEQNSAGINLPRVSTASLEEFEFALPPIPEQRRIVSKLDTLFASRQTAIAALSAVPTLLEDLRRSILYAATTGRLDREGSVSVVGWRRVPFEEILADRDKLSYGVLKPDTAADHGVSMYRVVDIGEWGVRSNTVPSTISARLSEEFKRTIIEQGDVLLSVMATIGRAMVATPDMVGANVNRALAVIKPDGAQIDSHFLLFTLLSPQVARLFLDNSIGSAQPRINLGTLRRLEIALPDLDEQRQIVKRVGEHFERITRIEQYYQEAFDAIDDIAAALLAKAMRGELVPQDPNDEPAAALIEGLRVIGDSSPKQKRSRELTSSATAARTRKDAAMTKSRFDPEVKDQPYLANLLRAAGDTLPIEELYRKADLSLADFYKQLAWEVAHDQIRDDSTIIQAL